MAPVLLVSGLVAALGGACSGAPARTAREPAPAAVVTIRNTRFTPKIVHVHAGQSVRWDFDDGQMLHGLQGVGAAATLIASGVQSSGSWTVNFPETGTYSYVCIVHETMMTGRIVVDPE